MGKKRVKLPVNNTMIDDLKDEHVPLCLYWSPEQVAMWLHELGFPQYSVRAAPVASVGWSLSRFYDSEFTMLFCSTIRVGVYHVQPHQRTQAN